MLELNDKDDFVTVVKNGKEIPMKKFIKKKDNTVCICFE